MQTSACSAGAALAQLDTSTNKAGVGAKVEYSDLKNEDGAQALNKLVQELIPQVRLQWSSGKPNGEVYMTEEVPLHLERAS